MKAADIFVDKDGVVCTSDDPYVLVVRQTTYFMRFFWIDALAGQCTGYPEVSFSANFPYHKITQLFPDDDSSVLVSVVVSNHRIQIGYPHNLKEGRFEQKLEIVGREDSCMLIGLTGQRAYQGDGGAKCVCESSQPFLLDIRAVALIQAMC